MATRVGFDTTTNFLLGSKTDMPIIIDDVDVEDYTNGFAPDGFKNISFD